MRVAQVAPLYEAVPPAGYGGTERVVSYLTEELVRMGVDVTLFASGDSITAAELVAGSPHAISLAPEPLDPLAWHTIQLGKVARRVHEFDVLHFHTDYLHYPFSRHLGQRSLTTLHGRLDLSDLAPLYREFRDIPVVSISNSQREPLPWANWQATVHHGLPEDLFEPSYERGSYLAFLGRLSPEKRPDWAIEIARCAGRTLRIAAKVDPADRSYYESNLAELLRQAHVEMVGEVGQADKGPFLAGASALIFPVDWPEPFGLVMIEALACGTPVIAFRRGSIPEVIEDGVTGYVVDTVEEAVDAVERIGELDRRRCRREFERRFSARRMATDYLGLYERMTEGLSTDWVETGSGRFPASAAVTTGDEKDIAPD
jgi:glycosyltransferase involved in cell wall biosynthesis